MKKKNGRIKRRKTRRRTGRGGGRGGGDKDQRLWIMHSQRGMSKLHHQSSQAFQFHYAHCTSSVKLTPMLYYRYRVEVLR